MEDQARDLSERKQQLMLIQTLVMLQPYGRQEVRIGENIQAKGKIQNE